MRRRAKPSFSYHAEIKMDGRTYRGDVALSPEQGTIVKLWSRVGLVGAARDFVFGNVQCIGGGARPHRADVMVIVGKAKCRQRLFREIGCRNMIGLGGTFNLIDRHSAPIRGRMEVTLRPNYRMEKGLADSRRLSAQALAQQQEMDHACCKTPCTILSYEECTKGQKEGRLVSGSGRARRTAAAIAADKISN